MKQRISKFYNRPNDELSENVKIMMIELELMILLHKTLYTQFACAEGIFTKMPPKLQKSLFIFLGKITKIPPFPIEITKMPLVEFIIFMISVFSKELRY